MSELNFNDSNQMNDDEEWQQESAEEPATYQTLSGRQIEDLARGGRFQQYLTTERRLQFPADWNENLTPYEISHEEYKNLSNTTQCYDVINLDEIKFDEYLEQDPDDNIIIISPASSSKFGGNAICFSRSELDQLLKNLTAIVLPCVGSGVEHPSFPAEAMTRFIRLSLPNMNIIVPEEDIIKISKSWDYSEIFQVEPTKWTIPTTATADTILNYRWVSGAHCQPGTSQIVYRLRGIHYENQPRPMNIRGFNQAQSFYDLLQLHLEFLNGSVTDFPRTAIMENTILESIKRLNKLGFLITDAQNGIQEEDTDSVTRDRAYITGLLPTFIAKALNKKFQVQSGFLCFTNPLRFSPRDEILTDPRIPVTVDIISNGQESIEASRPIVENQLNFLEISKYLTKKVGQTLFNQLSTITLFDTNWGQSDVLFERCIELLTSVVENSTKNWQYTCMLTENPNINFNHLKQLAKEQFPDSKLDDSNVSNLCRSLTTREAKKLEKRQRTNYRENFTNKDIADQAYNYHKEFYKHHFPSTRSIPQMDELDELEYDPYVDY